MAKTKKLLFAYSITIKELLERLIILQDHMRLRKINIDIFDLEIEIDAQDTANIPLLKEILGVIAIKKDLQPIENLIK